jgi:hypothetical protein
MVHISSVAAIDEGWPMRRPPVRHSRRHMTLLTLYGLTILAWAGTGATGPSLREHPPPVLALAKLHCKAFRASQQVEIRGTLAPTQHGTYTAVAQLVVLHK